MVLSLRLFKKCLESRLMGGLVSEWGCPKKRWNRTMVVSFSVSKREMEDLKRSGAAGGASKREWQVNDGGVVFLSCEEQKCK